MTGKVSKKILQDAEKEAAKIVAEAKEKAGSILEEAQKEANKIKEGAKKEAEEARKREEERILTIQRLEQNKKILELKRDVLDSVFEETRKELLNWKSQRYVDFMIKKLTHCLSSGDELVIPGKLHSTSFRKQLDKLKKERNLKFDIASEDGDFDFGFVVKKERTEIRYTDRDIIEEMKEEMDVELARRLFGNTE